MLLARRTRQLMSKWFDFLNFCTCHHQMLSSSNHHYFDEVSINNKQKKKKIFLMTHSIRDMLGML